MRAAGQWTWRRIGGLSVVAALSLSPAWLPAPVLAEGSASSISMLVGLGAGDQGVGVIALQQQLDLQGFSVGSDVPGVFGPGTESAVREFQTSVGLTADGVVDSATAERLVTGRHATPTPTPEPEPSEKPAATVPPEDLDEGFRAVESDSTDDGAVEESGGSESGNIRGSASSETGADRLPIDPSAQDDGRVGAAQLIGLQVGDRGAAVKRLQELLMGAGFSVVGGADGTFGVLTANALRSFQNANELDETGVVDQATAGALLDDDGADDDDHDPTVATTSLEGLRFGSVGADVRALQEALTVAGFAIRGGIDARFGSATLAAVRAFQASRGLGESGVVDRPTAEALETANRAVPFAHLIGLGPGSVGNTVRELQRELIDAGISLRGGADGIFGPATAAALKRFQEANDLDPSGRVDQATAAALADPNAPEPLADDERDDSDDERDDSDDADAGDGWAAYGERGARVVELQEALVAAGIELRGGVDGHFGGGTSAAVMEFQRRNRIRVTGRVDATTAAALGLGSAPPPRTPDPTSVRIQAFPVEGPCDFVDTWHAPRSGGRKHVGVDVIARTGNDLYAAADGTITKVYENYALAGNGVRLTMDDGTYFFYAHMSRIADGIEVGTNVSAGDVVGYVGETGNAGAPHLHFEVHPGGGAAVNPYPLLKPIDAC